MPVTDPEGRTVYVTGFLFATTPRLRWVALILKNRPAWQAGLLNGIGGKVEPEDGSLEAAMVREFREESGIASFVTDWHRFALVVSKRSRVHFFRADLGDVPMPTELPSLRGKDDTDEPCSWHPLNTLTLPPMPELVIPSLRFLIPLAEQPEFSQSVTTFQWTDATRPGEGT